jgi:hypothetical protein
MLYRAFEDCVPAAPIMGDGHAAKVAKEVTRAAIFHPSDFRDADSRPLAVQLAGSGFPAHEPEAVIATPAARSGESSPTSEESRVGLVQVAERLCEHGRLNGGDPRELCPESGDLMPLRNEVETPARARLILPPECPPLFERQIVNQPRHASGLPKQFLLLRHRVEPVTKGAVNHGLFLADQRFSSKQRSEARPLPKAPDVTKDTK